MLTADFSLKGKPAKEKITVLVPYYKWIDVYSDNDIRRIMVSSLWKVPNVFGVVSNLKSLTRLIFISIF